MRVKWFIVGWIARSIAAAFAEYRWERAQEDEIIRAVRGLGRSVAGRN